MGLFKKKKTQQQEIEKPKKKKKERGPQYLTSPINTRVLNYREYYMNARQKLVYTVLAFVAGALAGYLFYGGIGSDSKGNATPLSVILTIAICVGVGILAVKLFLPMRMEQLRIKRRSQLRQQFMDLLDSLASSIASGNNAIKSFEAAQNDLTMQYGEDSYIVGELQTILLGAANSIDLEVMIKDFGSRAGIQEIENFAQVFGLSYRRGGDFGKIIRDSYEILYNKINIEMEIETKVASTKNELKMMLVMPVLLVGMMKLSGGDFSRNFRTPIGALGTTVGLMVIAGAYALGKKIVDIEV